MKQSVIYTTLVIFNALTGYLFLRTLGMIYGVSVELSCFDLAFSIPFYIMSVSGFSFLHGIVSSILTKNNGKDKSEIYSSIFNTLILLSTTLIIIVYLGIDLAVNLIAPGIDNQYQNLIRNLIFIMLPMTLILGIGTFLGAVATAFYIPLPGEFPLLVARLFCIVLLSMTLIPKDIYLIAVTLLILSMGGLIIQYLVVAKKSNLNFSLVIKSSPEYSDFITSSIGFLLTAILATISSIYLKSLATLDNETTVSAISFALTITGAASLVIGKFFNFINTSRYAAISSSCKAEAKQYVNKSILFSIILSSICCMVIYAVLPFIVSILFETGKFGQNNVEQVSSLAAPLIWSIIPSTLLWVTLSPLLQGVHRNYTFSAYAIGYSLQIILNYCFFESLKANILVWSYTICNVIQAVICIFIIQIRSSESEDK